MTTADFIALATTTPLGWALVFLATWLVTTVGLYFIDEGETPRWFVPVKALGITILAAAFLTLVVVFKK